MDTQANNLKVTCKKDKEFSYNGLWHVTRGNKSATIYRDTNWFPQWLDASKVGTLHGHLGSTKKEAIETLINKGVL